MKGIVDVVRFLDIAEGILRGSRTSQFYSSQYFSIKRINRLPIEINNKSQFVPTCFCRFGLPLRLYSRASFRFAFYIYLFKVTIIYSSFSFTDYFFLRLYVILLTL